MGLWFVVLVAVEVVLFGLYVRYHKRYPVLNMPFDYRYRVFKRAYRAYAPVREDRKQYHVYAKEFAAPYLQMVESNSGVSYDKLKSANAVIALVANQEVTERYFEKSFGYSDYLALVSELDMLPQQFAATGDAAAKQPRQMTVPLFRKILILEALFRSANVDADSSNKARFIRNILEVEMDTEKIANTNVYKQIKKSKVAPDTEKEMKSRADDLDYAIKELKLLELDAVCSKLQKELDEYSVWS